MQLDESTYLPLWHMCFGVIMVFVSKTKIYDTVFISMNINIKYCNYNEFGNIRLNTCMQAIKCDQCYLIWL